mmetsp:Transcript_8459/g.13050  ORF Transcript_8459/g.13050 Transcript_8459/m.13050 type:complete len:205 (+) Transcript_8459:85-699(+)
MEKAIPEISKSKQESHQTLQFLIGSNDTIPLITITPKMSCQNTVLGEHLVCILSYNGSVIDTVLNYTILVANIIVVATPICNSRVGFRGASLSLLFVTIFQIMLCLVIVPCSGISIIWCSILGWMLAGWRKRSIHETITVTIALFQTIVIVLDFSIILYYAATSEPITTVAHILAIVVLGMPLYLINDRVNSSFSYQTIRDDHN